MVSGFELLEQYAASVSPRHPPLYHGTSPLLAESIHLNGLRPHHGHVFLTPSKALAWAFAAWATGMVIADGNHQPLPELCTTPVGQTVKDGYQRGPNLTAVCTISLPQTIEIELADAGAPILPWEHQQRTGQAIKLGEPIEPEWITGWELYRIPELLDPTIIDRMARQGDTLAHNYPRDAHGLLEDIAIDPIGDIPNPRRLLATILDTADTTLDDHTVDHWMRVADYGLRLLTPNVDPTIILLFALLHDSQRLTDGHDPDHGTRAATLARALNTTNVYNLNTTQLDTLTIACERHSHGDTSTHPTIGACWDADRLDLARYGHQRNQALMSTEAGQRLAVQSPLANTRTPVDIINEYRTSINIETENKNG